MSYLFASRIRASRSPSRDVPYQEREQEDEESLFAPVNRPLLAAVDLTALLIFAAVRKVFPTAGAALDLSAIAPFVFVWFITSPVSGVYAKSEDARSDLYTVTKAWILSFPIGYFIRAIRSGYIPPTSHVAIAFFSTLFHLIGARLFFAMMDQNAEDEDEDDSPV